MKTVNIYIKGYYDCNNRIGTWTYYLECNGAVKKQSGSAGGLRSVQQTTLIALVKALECINQPCNLMINSKYPLGFKNPKQSSNKELLFKILNMVNNAGHIVNFNDKASFVEVDKWEKLYGNNKNKQENIKNKLDLEKEEEKQLEKMAEEANQDWRAMYSDLMGPSQGCWVPGSGGY